MEFLQGATLKHLIANRSLGLKRILEIGIDTAEDCTRHIRRASFIATSSPRTSSSRNSVMQRSWIFGLAKLTAHSAEATTAGIDGNRRAIRGASDQLRKDSWTVAYMSPEQAPWQGPRRSHRPLLVRRCAVRDGNWCVAVPWPYLGGDLRRDSQPDTFGAWRVSNPDLPPKLENITDKALEKDRDVRYQRADDIRADLKRLWQELEPRFGPWHPNTVEAPNQIVESARADGRGRRARCRWRTIAGHSTSYDTVRPRHHRHRRFRGIASGDAVFNETLKASTWS
jgi:hypothetical protein